MNRRARRLRKLSRLTRRVLTPTYWWGREDYSAFPTPAAQRRWFRRHDRRMDLLASLY
jgi:hypothetical protein